MDSLLLEGAEDHNSFDGDQQSDKNEKTASQLSTLTIEREETKYDILFTKKRPPLSPQFKKICKTFSESYVLTVVVKFIPQHEVIALQQISRFFYKK